MRPSTLQRHRPKWFEDFEKALARRPKRKEQPPHWRVVSRRHTLDIELVRKHADHEHVLLRWSPTDWIDDVLGDMIHLPGLRGLPERAYQVGARPGGSYTGTFDRYAPSVIAAWKESGAPELSMVAQDLQTLGLAQGASVSSVDDTHVEIRVTPMGGQSEELAFNLADVGTGVWQALPIIVAIYEAKPGQLVFIEQPEVHLHPAAQSAFGEVLARAAARGKALVVETHSHLIIRGIQTAVARKNISPSQVMFHWFGLDASGSAEITSAQPETDGSLGDWPSNLDEINRRAAMQFLEASFTIAQE